MELEISGQGLDSARLSSVQAGLANMGYPNSKVIIADNFVTAVKELTGLESYSAGRGAGVVAAKTVLTAEGCVIVVNGPEVRHRSLALVERLMAHEAGHIALIERGESIKGRDHLAASEREWELMCVAAFALDELRIERTLADLGYPVSVTGETEFIGDAMHSLNWEIVNALLDPSSADTTKFRQTVGRTHDWLSKHLAYVAAFHSGTSQPNLSTLDRYANDNWQDYIAAHWLKRAAFYAEIPNSRAPMSDAVFNQTLVDGIGLERDLLQALGFTLLDLEGDRWAFRRIASDDLCQERVKRALAEADFRDTNRG